MALLEQPADLRERLLLGDARDVLGPRERHLGHRRRLDRQRAKVLGLERVDVRLAARAREHLQLHRHRGQEVVDALRGLVHDQPPAQLGVLRRDPDRAAPRVAVVALARRHSDRALVVGDAWDLLVAVEGHQRGRPDGNGVRSQREALGDVRSVA